MQTPIQFSDLQKFDDSLDQAQAEDMISTAWARAGQAAPCLRDNATELGAADLEIVKDVMRSAILRWAERGSGAVVQRTAGEYGETLARIDDSGNLFRPQEIRDLRSVCGNVRKRGRASTISTIPTPTTVVPTVHPFLTGTEGDYPADAWGL
ncbi:hypothetical protein L5I01_21975 [Gordonia sp. HY442]|uniref:hypothetical protein n=1 Tax=Gordonia zhenghanii TaxID=2911516 RepID=UPI001F2CD903|nr:hypothetical protein [Gordonia zhenghanii]MCF8606024.1 hypothetical protein [Gordonia zhenghanii]